MKENKKKRKSINMGTSLILVTFVILCLIAFAALSFSSANADLSKTKQTATRNSAYYSAHNISQETQGRIAKELKEQAALSTDENDFYKRLSGLFSDMEINVKRNSNVYTISYINPINDNTCLKTVLSASYNNRSVSCRLISEQSINTEDL